MARWKAYWIMRGVEAYLIRHSNDKTALALVTRIIDTFEKEQAL